MTRMERQRIRERRNSIFAFAIVAIAVIAMVVLTLTVRAFFNTDDEHIEQKRIHLEATPSMPELEVDLSLPRDYVPATEYSGLEMIPLVDLGEFTITHYDVCERCCGKTDGITASGEKAVPYSTVAVDPDLIPLGSKIYIEYSNGSRQLYFAHDTGGAIQGRKIDVCVMSHNEACKLGVMKANVYLLED